VGGIVLVRDEGELARVLGRVYAALGLPFRPSSVGSLRRTGSKTKVEEVVGALAEEAKLRYGATPVPVDEGTKELARLGRTEYLVRPSA
jgi:hypothetical protein